MPAGVGAALLLVLAATTAWSTPQTFNDYNAWLASTSNLYGTVTFSELNIPSGSVYYMAPTGAGPLVISGVTFDGWTDDSNRWLQAVNPSPSQWWYDWGTGASLLGPAWVNANTRIRITPPAGDAVTALAFNLFTVNPNAGSVIVRIPGLTDQWVTTLARGANPPAFFGITVDSNISYVELFVANGQSSHAIMVDNVRWGQAASQPAGSGETAEVTTAILIGSGLLLMMARRRRWYGRIALS
jgi:hypothetical protein